MHELTIATVIVVGLVAVRHAVLLSSQKKRNWYPVVFGVAFGVAYLFSGDVRVSLLVALVALAARAAYRYTRPGAVKKPLGPECTGAFAAFIASAIGASMILRSRPTATRWGLYLALYYWLGSLVEYGIHKYVMHCYAFAPGLLKTSFRKTCLSHWRHHRSVQSDMSLRDVEDEHELVFDWALTTKLGLAVGAAMWGLAIAMRLRVPLKMHVVITAAMVVGFSIVWNTVHPTMHGHVLQKDIAMPPALPYELRGGLWYDNHAIHHLVKGPRKGNYNVVYLGADELLGANRLT